MISRICFFPIKRSLSTSSVKRNDSILARIKDFVFSTEKENFHEDFVRRAHKWDNISRKEWKLVYKDLGASRTFFLVSTLLPVSFVGFMCLLVDRTVNSSQNRSTFTKRLERDAQEMFQLGILSIFPAIAVVLVSCILLRVHSLRLLRVYQNRDNVEHFIAIRSNWVVSQNQMKFHRDLAGAFYYDEEKEVQKIALSFLFGNIQIGNRKFLVLDENFIGNNFRSYMLNETSLPPRLKSQK